MKIPSTLDRIKNEKVADMPGTCNRACTLVGAFLAACLCGRTTGLKENTMNCLYKRTTCMMLVIVGLILILSGLTGCENEHTENTETQCLETHTQPEEYSVLLAAPAFNQTLLSTDPPPIFAWTVQKGLPQEFVVEIKYSDDAPYIIGEIRGGNTYLLPEDDWETIKNKSLIVDGVKMVEWRVRIDYKQNDTELSYYSRWGYFWIASE